MKAHWLLGIVLFGCAPAPEPRRLPFAVSAHPSATAEAVTEPSRTYTRGPRGFAVIDETGPFDNSASVSPDGLLVALHPDNSPTLVFYDVDRRRIVGRSAVAMDALTSAAPLWVDDDHLLASGYHSAILYDARSGALIGQVPNGVPAAIATKSGFATLAKDPAKDSATLVSFADPTKELARIEVQGYIKEAFDLGDGAFGYVGPRGAYAFEPDGKPRWQREEKTLSPETFGPPKKLPADPRVTVTSQGIFERGRKEPLLRFERSSTPRVIEPALGAGFAARCENGKTALLGTGSSLPSNLGTKAGGSEQPLLSKDGSYSITWASNNVTVTEVASGKARVLDAGGPIRQVALHPNGTSLVTGAFIQGIGMGWHPDPNASVRIFDLKSGAPTKKLFAESFRFSDDGSKLLVLGSEEASLLDAGTYQALRTWRGMDNDVSLDRAARFALVKTHERPLGGLGPHETKELFVEELAKKRRVMRLPTADGYFAFDDAGARLAFAGHSGTYETDVRGISVYDLRSGKVSATLRADEPISRLALLGDGKILAIWSQRGLVLHRLQDGRRVSVHALPESDKCRLFAVDDEAHFQGEPGGRLAFRYGDDLRTSEVVVAEAARADDRLLEKFFAGP